MSLLRPTEACKIGKFLILWKSRSRMRSELRKLDLRELRDMGLSTFDRDRECNKQFWQPVTLIRSTDESSLGLLGEWLDQNDFSKQGETD